MKNQWQKRAKCPTDKGFSLIELAIASMLLLFGIVAVAQLVPASMRLNSSNRNDSTALVFAQREMQQMTGQQLSALSFVDAQGFTCNLGDPAAPNTVVGNPVAVISNQPAIDFGATPVVGYSFNYADPNDPSGTQYDVRWAVVTTTNGAAVIAKRFILGARRLGGNSPFQPITLDSVVEK